MMRDRGDQAALALAPTSDKQYLRILPRPLHLPPTTRVSRSRGPASSSERGRSFRERRQRRMKELEQQVETLQREVASLVSSRALSEGRLLQRRHNNKDSSLVRLVREYYTIFQYGLRDGPASVDSVALHPPKNTTYKENFIRSIMAEDVVTGDLVGLEAALLQWRFFTYANEDVRVAIEHVDISGSEDDPCVEIHAQFHFLTHPMLLARAFPGAESNPELMKIFGRKQLVIPVVSRFQFTPEGKIRFEDVNANIIAGYMNAGVSLDDIANLMRYSVISAKSTMQQGTVVPEYNAVAHEANIDNNNALDGPCDMVDPVDEDSREPHPFDKVRKEKESDARDKLSVEYLLSSEP